MRGTGRTALLGLGLFLSAACSFLAPAPAATSAADPGNAASGAVEPAISPEPVTPTPTSAGNPVQIIHPVRYRVENAVVVSNGGFTITELLLYQPKPVGWDGQINVVEESVTPSNYKVGRDPQTGTEMYYWQLFNTPARGKAIEFKNQFTFTAYETRTAIDPDGIPPYNTLSPAYRLYTKAEPYIESTDPLITNLADKLAGNETNPFRLARRFYDYVVAHAHYQLIEGFIGAKGMLINNAGECGDFSALFIALARAKGIPARAVVGLWALSGTDQSHVWAEFYLQDIGWIPVDPTIGQSEPSKFGIPAYYFGNMDNQRVIMSKGFNVQLDPPARDVRTVALLQGANWWYWGSAGDGSKVRLDFTTWRVTAA
jgi:hypothetical protein